MIESYKSCKVWVEVKKLKIINKGQKYKNRNWWSLKKKKKPDYLKIGFFYRSTCYSEGGASTNVFKGWIVSVTFNVMYVCDKGQLHTILMEVAGKDFYINI